MRRRGPQQRHVGSDRAALDYLLNHENQRRIVALDDTTLGEMVSTCRDLSTTPELLALPSPAAQARRV
jgi:hypothetical protein